MISDRRGGAAAAELQVTSPTLALAVTVAPPARY